MHYIERETQERIRASEKTHGNAGRVRGYNMTLAFGYGFAFPKKGWLFWRWATNKIKKLEGEFLSCLTMGKNGRLLRSKSGEKEATQSALFNLQKQSALTRGIV